MVESLPPVPPAAPPTTTSTGADIAAPVPPANTGGEQGGRGPATNRSPASTPTAPAPTPAPEVVDVITLTVQQGATSNPTPASPSPAELAAQLRALATQLAQSSVPTTQVLQAGQVVQLRPLTLAQVQTILSQLTGGSLGGGAALPSSPLPADAGVAPLMPYRAMGAGGPFSAADAPLSGLTSAASPGAEAGFATPTVPGAVHQGNAVSPLPPTATARADGLPPSSNLSPGMGLLPGVQEAAGDMPPTPVLSGAVAGPRGATITAQILTLHASAMAGADAAPASPFTTPLSADTSPLRLNIMAPLRGGQALAQVSDEMMASAASLRGHYYLLQAPGSAIPSGGSLTLQPMTIPMATHEVAGSFSWGEWGRNLGLVLTDLLDALPPQVAAQTFGAAGRPPIPQAQSQAQAWPAALWFMSALRSGGDAQGWLGERGVEALKRAGKGGLIERLNDALSGLRRASESLPNAEWRSFLIPLQFQTEVMPIRLHHHLYDAERHDRDQPPARYVIEVDFDQMGAVQLDLLYRPQQLDTILRTELPLSAAMRGVLERKYAGAMENVGHTGALYFQHGLSHWVTIDAPPESATVLLA